jgi:hypothetical protein
MAKDNPEYEKPKLTLLGVFAWPWIAAFNVFVSTIRFLTVRPSDLTPDQTNKKVQERQRIERRKGR